MDRCIFMCLLFSFVLPIRSQDDQCPGAQAQDPTEPCADADDIKTCVQNYLSDVTTCNDPENQGSDVIVKDNAPRYLPSYNVTTSQNVTITGLSSGNVISFIVDSTTDIMVITTEFQNLNFTGPNTVKYFQNNKEPKTFTSSLTSLYPQVIFTSVLDSASEPIITKTYTVANITLLPTIILGDEARKCQDPDLVRLYAALKANPGPAAIETFQTFSPLIMNTYIKNEFCGQ